MNDPNKNSQGYPPQYVNPSQPVNQGQPGFFQAGSQFQPIGGVQQSQGSSLPGFSNPAGFGPNAGFPQQGLPQMPQQASTAGPIPSLRPAQNMSIEMAVNTLKKILTTFKADEVAIYNVLAHSTSQQREHIKADYKRGSLNELTTDCLSRFSNESKYFMNGLLDTGAEFDAFILNKATEYGINHEIVSHIFATRTHEQLQSICASFQRLFKDDLVKRIETKAIANYGKLLTFLLRNPRDMGGPQTHDIKRHVENIKHSSHAIFGVSENVIPILAKSSIPHLHAVAQSYEQCYKENICKPFEKCKGEYPAALKSICDFMLNPASYFAEFLKRNIDGGKIEAIIIVACTRCEYDLGSISTCYTTKYGTNLGQDVSNKFCKKHGAIVEGILMLLGMR